MILVTMIYLFVPYFIFFFGWLKITYAIFMMGILGYGLYLSARDTQFESSWKKILKVDSREFLLVLGIFFLALVWTSFSGIGGFGYQNPDYTKHNMILNDLILRPWPTYYGAEPGASGGMPSTLVYYLAYYLPSALVGKTLGWEAANYFQFFWACMGVFLAFWWFLRIVQHKSIWVLVIFIFAGGLDIVGNQIIHSRFVSGSDHIEWWARGHFQYSANTSLLVWVPQHGIAGWLATSLLMDQFSRSNSCKHYGLILASTLFWSPFVALGLAPLILIFMFKNRFKDLVNINNFFVAPLVAVLIVLYYGALGHGVPMSAWGIYDVLTNLPILVLFLILEFGLYAYLCFFSPGIVQGKNLWVMYTVVTILCVLPLFRMGLYNDLPMRASIPALYIMWVFVARAIFNTKEGRGYVVSHILRVVFFVGAFTGLAEINRAIESYSIEVPQQRFIAKAPSLLPPEVARQYLGNPNSFFFQTLASELVESK